MLVFGTKSNSRIVALVVLEIWAAISRSWSPSQPELFPKLCIPEKEPGELSALPEVKRIPSLISKLLPLELIYP